MPAPPSSRWRQPFVPVKLDLSTEDSFTRPQRRAISITETLAQVVGVIAAVLRHGLRDLAPPLSLELGGLVVASLLLLFGLFLIRFRASLARASFRRRRRADLVIFTIWLVAAGALLIAGPGRFGLDPEVSRQSALFGWSALVILARGIVNAAGLIRGVTAEGVNPAVLLVSSFALLIFVGTLLLMLPKCRAAGAPPMAWQERLQICAFTATSASCVTGLVLVDTGGPDAYWSRTGQVVILGLIQAGGLGIMTFGAFFAVMTGRSLRLRESATLQELFNPDQPIDIRRLVLIILAFTFGTELAGALLLGGLWPELAPGERAFYCLFHSVSAFCNAGFDLTGNSFVGRGGAWQVWGVIAGLIILGGIGFGTVNNLAHVAASRMFGRRVTPLETEVVYRRRLEGYRPPRVSMATRLILVTTAVLLVLGGAWNFLVEATQDGTLANLPLGERLANSWFQSVTWRTAGFNTIDHAELRPASKLFAIVLMFIGASPVSTGGGVKTAAIAVTVLSISSILRARPRAEAFGRTLPEEIVRRALAIIAIGMILLVVVTLLLASFENESQFKLIDLMYEAASACGTVGATTGVTRGLSDASQFVLIAAMFLGRVGPLTLLLGLARPRLPVAYRYPEERVTLG